MDELFAPPAYDWKRLSPQYRRLRRLTTVLVAPIIFSIPAVIVGVASGMWWISAILWGIAAAILASTGKKKMDQVRGPEATAAELKADKALAQDLRS